ncbi:MAG: acyl-CoA dehydrogenase family protein [Mycobacterium sp.]|uniref:acyl-CoA dehydrogenase family protein n=1 Tax=Mycobacterium sp. TaxID=1785 RepID=UPI003C4B1F90
MNVSVATAEREMLDVASKFACEHFRPNDLRELRDGTMGLCDIRARWQKMAELGWVGMVLPESRGGEGGGFADLTAVLRALGRSLATVPFATSLTSMLAIEHGTEAGYYDGVLCDICRGELLVVPAFGHSPRFSAVRPDTVDVVARRASSGHFLSGAATRVLDAPLADKLLIAARLESATYAEGLALFLVDIDAPGLSLEPGMLIDSRTVATAEFDAVPVDADAMVVVPSRAIAAIDVALDRAAVAVAAELFGVAEEAFDRTIEYLMIREQFGVPIGAFQALQHRAAQLLCSLELSGAILSHASKAIDASTEEVADLASVCKAQLSDTAVHVAEEAVQMHGGIGVCDECDIGLFLKRARVLEWMLGDSAYHRDRYATRNNF